MAKAKRAQGGQAPSTETPPVTSTHWAAQIGGGSPAKPGYAEER